MLEFKLRFSLEIARLNQVLENGNICSDLMMPAVHSVPRALFDRCSYASETTDRDVTK